ncbi:MAG: hypothetical protein JWL64_2179 [Frankiales bacterium]|nr:hypothetical protein [Frankiales bacterium]
MLTVRLLGPPVLDRDGVPVRRPRGQKAWALLGYLLLAERPPGRRQLAELLFADADDPLGALRWTLSELRRALGVRDAFTGDPVGTRLGPDVLVDVHQLTGGPALLAVEGELLDGVELRTCPEFSSWLLVARHRLSSQVEAGLREQAAALLAAGRPDQALPYAARAVARNSFEEGNHALLVRCLALAGDEEAALRQVAVGEDLLRRELGVTASGMLRDAARVTPNTATGLSSGGRATALNQLEAGRAAIVAGAVDAGLQSLRRAVADAERSGDRSLHGRALAALGSALVHAVRGRDEEGSVALHQALMLATETGDRATAVAACRELGFVEVQAGRGPNGRQWLARATGLAETDAELAAVLGLTGMAASDRADYPAALRQLSESVERARRCGDRRQQAWSLSVLARAHLLRAEHSQSRAAISRCLDLVREERWMAFLPWPQALRAELDLATGDLTAAAEGLESAWVQACQIGDPCWEGMAARGLGLLHSQHGDAVAATAWMEDAMKHSDRVPDRYQWVRAYVLDAAVGTALAHGDRQRAGELVEVLASLAARCDLRELVVRAHLHRARLGDTSALGAARLLGADIDNPALVPLLRPAARTTPTRRTA